MSSLPATLRDEKSASELFEANWKRWFFDPRRWRVALEDIKGIAIRLLHFNPPYYDFLINVTTKNNVTLQFYESVAAVNSYRKNELLIARTGNGESSAYLVDAYTNNSYVTKLMEAWHYKRTLGALGFVGEFEAADDESDIRIDLVEPLLRKGETVTTNYLYRYAVCVESKGRRRLFNLMAKRFLPREPLTRGNHEYAMLHALPSRIVPKTYGALTNQGFKLDKHGQILAVFEEYIEDAVEIGKEIWNLMEQISKRRHRGHRSDPELDHLCAIVKGAVEEVVFPLHLAGFNAWHSKGVAVRLNDDYYDWYHRELEQNLLALKKARVIPESYVRFLSRVFTVAWKHVLEMLKVTEIHGDLMWRQIIRTTDGRLLILDLDEHKAGHAAKDVADLCAANLFIAEDLQSEDAEFMLRIAHSLNDLILKTYNEASTRSSAMWAEDLERAVQVYLAFRHLHDAAYFAPVWHHETKAVEKKRYKRYVDFSLTLLKESIKHVDDMTELKDREEALIE